MCRNNNNCGLNSRVCSRLNSGKKEGEVRHMYLLDRENVDWDKFAQGTKTFMDFYFPSEGSETAQAGQAGQAGPAPAGQAGQASQAPTIPTDEDISAIINSNLNRPDNKQTIIFKKPCKIKNICLQLFNGKSPGVGETIGKKLNTTVDGLKLKITSDGAITYEQNQDGTNKNVSKPLNYGFIVKFIKKNGNIAQLCKNPNNNNTMNLTDTDYKYSWSSSIKPEDTKSMKKDACGPNCPIRCISVEVVRLDVDGKVIRLGENTKLDPLTHDVVSGDIPQNIDTNVDSYLEPYYSENRLSVRIECEKSCD